MYARKQTTRTNAAACVHLRAQTRLIFAVSPTHTRSRPVRVHKMLTCLFATATHDNTPTCVFNIVCPDARARVIHRTHAAGAG